MQNWFHSISTKTFYFIEYFLEKKLRRKKKTNLSSTVKWFENNESRTCWKITSCVSKFCFLFKWFDTFNDFLTAFWCFLWMLKLNVFSYWSGLITCGHNKYSMRRCVTHTLYQHTQSSTRGIHLKDNSGIDAFDAKIWF